VKPQMAAHISVEEMDSVAQTVDTAPGAGFDLVVALEALSRYNRVEQSLALANIAAMTNRGAIVLARGASPSVLPGEFEELGTRRIAYSDRGGAISISVYRRR
jgi:hypothetical protein